MLDISWSSAIAKDPLLLADAIELVVAFASDEHYGRFTRADFQHFVATENLTDDEESYLTGDQVDERNAQFEQALKLIRNRARWLGLAYPFSVVTDEVQFTPQTPLRRHLPYLFLLVCSNGNHVPSLQNTLATHFEDLCKEALRSLFPGWAEVVSFSQKSDDRKNIFGYQASKAVPRLAEKLNAGLVNANQLSATQREFGIDIIAICPFGDGSPFPFFAFAQCTIGREWWGKRHEAIAENELTGFVNLNARHSNFLMIPHFPRYSLEQWSEDPARTGNCILCDRLRICVLVNRSDSFSQDNPPREILGVFKTLEDNLVQSSVLS